MVYMFFLEISELYKNKLL